MNKMKHLSIVDGAFLHLESAEMPMHVGSLHLFEPPAHYQGNFYESVKEHVARRMHLAPVFTRKLALMPFDLANPVWIHDDDIDLDYHIRYLVLPKPGSFAQLEALAARLHSSLLDRSRPLWEFYVIEGLADGRIGFYAKVHHAAVDGQAGVAMGRSMFDLTPEPRAVKPPRQAQGHRYQLGVAELLAAGLQNQLQQIVGTARLLPRIASTLFGAARDAIVARGAETPEGKAARKAAPSGPRLKFAPPTPFNTPITNQRAFAAVSLPLPEVKRIGKAFGASINDTVLWLCSTALRAYLKEGGELPDASLVAGVPISLRAEGDTSMNNQVTGTVIDLGTQIADPLQRLQSIMRATAAMKRQIGTFGGIMPTDFPSLGAPWLLSGLASLYGRSRIAGWLRLINVTISNVPGSKVPVYLAGARMVDYYPVSIVVHGVALNITVQSHVDQLCFGLIACRRAVPDVRELADQLPRALEVLRSLPLPVAAAETVPVQAAPPRVAAKAVPVARKVATKRAPARGNGADGAALQRVEPPQPARRPARAKPRLAVVASAAKPRKPRAGASAR
jgi:WS/DGAT/MGAT family acyltransferase